MAVINPIEESAGATPGGGATFSGRTRLVITGEVVTQSTAPIRFVGRTRLVVNGSLLIRGSCVFAGRTLLSATGRVNTEANVFGSCVFAGRTLLSVSGIAPVAPVHHTGSCVFVGRTRLSAAGEVTRPTPSVTVTGSATFSGRTLLSVSGVVTAEEPLPSFTIFVSILDTALATAQSANVRRFNARLTASGVDVPLRRATLSAPEGRLGTELSVVLARPDVAAVNLASQVSFEVGLWTGAAWQWVPAFTSGKLSSRRRRLANDTNGLPADTVELTINDATGDRFNRAPRVPTLLYDPLKVDAPSAAALTIYTATGAQVVPTIIAISNMRLRDVLDYAFITGCGFARVVTNIENFPVEQATFSLEGGYDAGVRSLLTLFEPETFAIGNDLWIVGSHAAVPAGITTRSFPASNSQTIDDSLPGREPINALLVRLRDDAAGEYSTERVETPPPVQTGTFGAPGYTSTAVERRIREYRRYAAPTVVVRQELISTKTTITDENFAVIERETLTDTYDSLRRVTGYQRTVDMNLPDLDGAEGAKLLQSALSESQVITYAPHPLDPKVDTQSNVVTRTSGLILVDSDNEYLGEPNRLPYLDAHRSAQIDQGGGQTTEFGSIRTEFVNLRVNGGQVQRERRVINHLSNAPDSTTTQTAPGDTSIARQGSSGSGTRTVLLTTPGTEGASGRRVPVFDASSLPSDLGLRLATRYLANLNSPPRELAIDLSYYDLQIRRGGVLSVSGRADVLGIYTVRSYSATFTNEGEGFSASMSLNAREKK
ncbi:MAG: hypothetical protein M3458_05350 [Acidobacteriota bacterium]|nr:hypothetical protein [Acidobacteriota bacterium]